MRLFPDLGNGKPHQPFACAHSTRTFRYLCVLYKLNISIFLFAIQGIFEDTKGGMIF